MSNLNKVMLIGRLGRDPEVRYLPNGAAVANFSIATSEKYKDKVTGEAKENTEWHNVVVYDRLAEIVQTYLKKGSLVYIEGKLKTRKYEDKQGITRYVTEVHAMGLQMLGYNESNAGNSSPQQPILNQSNGQTNLNQIPPYAGGGIASLDDDIPF